MKMNKKFNAIFIIIVLLCFLHILATSCSAQYANFRIIEPRMGDEPLPKAIVWSGKKAVVLIEYKDKHQNYVDKARIDSEWHIKEIKRETVILGRTSEKRFIEYYVNPDKRPNKKYSSFSIYCQPISLWEAIHILTDAFEYNAVMHNLCGGSVFLQKNANSFESLLDAITPPDCLSEVRGNTVYFYSKNISIEKIKETVDRKKSFNYKALSMRFPSLEKKKNLISIGEDIQYILSLISIEGKVPIKYPPELHFAVYANFKEVPYYKILSDIVYTNQCLIIERETGLEVIPWEGSSYMTNFKDYTQDDYPPLPPLKTQNRTYYDDSDYDSGPCLPPLYNGSRYIEGKSMGYFSDDNGHPFVVQPYPATNGNSNRPGDSR